MNGEMQSASSECAEFLVKGNHAQRNELPLTSEKFTGIAQLSPSFPFLN
jgi:hypothetical protein